MNLKRIMEIYDIIKARLPSTYPHPKLAFYEDEQSLSDNMRMKISEGTNLYAVCDPDTNTVMMPLSMNFIYETKYKTISKAVPLNKMDEEEIAQTLLHEIGHLYFGQRYGYGSEQYSNEQACNDFAYRWIKKMKKEKVL